MSFLVPWIAPLFVVGALQDAPAPVGHLRLCNRVLVDLARDATIRSATFDSLARHIEESSVIVFARIARCPQQVESCLHFLASDAETRSLRISISWAGIPPAHMAGLLAHELQHAREVADATHVRDLRSFASFFKRLGWAGRGGFETCDGPLLARRVEAEFESRAASDTR